MKSILVQQSPLRNCPPCDALHETDRLAAGGLPQTGGGAAGIAPASGRDGRLPFLIILLLALAMLPVQGAGGADDARRLSDVLTGDAKGPASANAQCKLFTPAEISIYLGQAAQDGQNAGQGLGCQWVSAQDDADAMVMVVPRRYHERPTLAPGFKTLVEPGTDGFVVPEMGGWAAGAVLDDRAIRVAVTGPKVTEQSALSLLLEAARRLR